MQRDAPRQAAENHQELVRVVAAVIRDGERYLLCKRPAGKRHGGLWEFPGGKMHEGESVFEAVRRELEEELGVAITHVGERLAAHRDEGSPYLIEFYPVGISGTPECREHERIEWMGLADVQAASLAPSDRAFVARSILPAAR